MLPFPRLTPWANVYRPSGAKAERILNCRRSSSFEIATVIDGPILNERSLQIDVVRSLIIRHTPPRHCFGSMDPPAEVWQGISSEEA